MDSRLNPVQQYDSIDLCQLPDRGLVWVVSES
jgi:hypothetical protein